MCPRLTETWHNIEKFEKKIVKLSTQKMSYGNQNFEIKREFLWEILYNGHLRQSEPLSLTLLKSLKNQNPWNPFLKIIIITDNHRTHTTRWSRYSHLEKRKCHENQNIYKQQHFHKPKIKPSIHLAKCYLTLHYKLLIIFQVFNRAFSYKNTWKMFL